MDEAHTAAKRFKIVKQMMKPPAVQMHLGTNYIMRHRHHFPDPSTVYEIIDSDEEDVVCLESSFNKPQQSAGTLDHIEQQFSQRNPTTATISSMTSTHSTISSPRIVNFVIEPNPSTSMSSVLATATSSSPQSFVNFVFVHKRPQQIFSAQQEEELSRFVRDASDFYNGMTSKDVRILAYVYGVCNQVRLPVRWRAQHEASFAWCAGFTKRHKLRLINTFGNSQPNKSTVQD